MSIRDFITGDRVARKIKMLKSSFRNKNFLVVEGITDRRLYEKFIDQNNCHIIDADTRENVIECVNTLVREKFLCVLGIIDSDFSKITGECDTNEYILSTDTHDLETMMIESPALENIIVEYADRNKFLEFIKDKGSELRAILLKAGQVIGNMRLCSSAHKYRFCFKELDYKKFIDEQSLEINEDKLIDEVFSNSPKKKISDKSIIKQEMLRLAKREYDPWHICCGHDLTEIILIGLKSIFGDYNSRHLILGNLEGSFRLSYEFAYFSETELYKKILEWEKKNSGKIIAEHRVLKAS
jgi:hypothetical protein